MARRTVCPTDRWMTARTSNSHSTFVPMGVAVTRLDPAVARRSRSSSPCRDAVLGRCARARRKGPALKRFAVATGLRSSTVAVLPRGPSRCTRRASTPTAAVRAVRVWCTTHPTLRSALAPTTGWGRLLRASAKAAQTNKNPARSSTVKAVPLVSGLALRPAPPSAPPLVVACGVWGERGRRSPQRDAVPHSAERTPPRSSAISRNHLSEAGGARPRVTVVTKTRPSEAQGDPCDKN
jgi:hypothetical protein